MNAITLISSQPWVERLGWTLLHFLWQGLLISVLYAAARRAARSARPDTRYLLACFALAAMAVAPLATWTVLGRSAAPGGAPVLSAALPSAAGAAAAPGGPLAGTVVYGSLPEPLLPWVVAVWMAGATMAWLRFLGGWFFAIRLRSKFVRPAAPEWQETFDRLRTQLRVWMPVRLLVSSLVQAPAVVGWLRPVVLVPVGALTGLPPEQVEALLLHELAHIRRGDYLVNLLQSIVEAFLFYHPAVWWISGHLRTERELCCDDVAVAASGDVLAYARALAELEAGRPEHFHAALAASGGSLADRIARLLGQPRRASRTIDGPAAAAGAVLLLITAVGVFGQNAAQPRFEVASIKPSAEQRFMMVRVLPGGRLTATAPVQLLIQNAYTLQACQIVGSPNWVNSDRYQIEAKGETGASRAEVMLMLKSLLEDRFQLKTHTETRELPVFALVQTKSGSKLAPPKEGGCIAVAEGTLPPPPPAGQPFRTPCGHAGVMGLPTGARLQGGAVAMPEFIRILAMVLGRPVIDKTGIGGTFDVQLDFSPDAGTAGLPTPVGPSGPVPSTPPADAANPGIFSAIQEQLGLKLESTKGPVPVLVIDHVERPSAN